MTKIRPAVTTKNEEGNIGHCLRSVLSQTYPRERLEVIVVDNNSEDRTKKITEAYAEHILDWPAVRTPPQSGTSQNPNVLELSGPLHN